MTGGGEGGRFIFPPLENTPSGDIVLCGGSLSPETVLSAYEQGYFPWPRSERDRLPLWCSPDPRFVIFPEKLHVSRSMERVLARGGFDIAFDRDFEGVIRRCAEVRRPGQRGTWITSGIIRAFTALHELGLAHSAEAYHDGVLAGGCYGLRLGRLFAGESMFHLRPDASKAAFLTLARALFSDGVALIDCQVHSDHLESLGGENISRGEYLRLLADIMAGRGEGAARDAADKRGNWDARRAGE
ncbi:MAG: leucyl/phenylalanyl-tRNA--protein transferase [Treponematales bacterium]